MDETMTMDEALAELAAVGARVKTWTPINKFHVRPTLYVNGPHGEKLGEIMVSPAGYCTARNVWAAIANHVSSK